MSTKNSIVTPAHQHKLEYVNTVEYFANKGMKGWTCDACKRTSKELQQSHSYRCTRCDFDLCKGCTKTVKTSKHEHSLKVTNAGTVYATGTWGCDNCGTYSQLQGPLSWHCVKGCEFDLCYGCTKEHKSTAHRHMLKKVNPVDVYPTSNGWACNLCKNEFNKDNLVKPYNCKKCNFDLCENCLKDTVVITEVVEEIQKQVEKTLTVTDGGAKKPSPVGKDDSAAAVFISYQWDIQEKVLKLKKKLEANKITCWMDTGKLAGGDDLKREIDKGIRGCKLMVSCVTNAYSRSRVCQQEVALADALKTPILPVLFESVSWPPEGPMSMPFAQLVYISCEKGLTTENLKTVLTTVQSKVQ